MTQLQPANPQSADLIIGVKPFMVQANVDVTPSGLLAITALVSGILLSTAALIWVVKK